MAAPEAYGGYSAEPVAREHVSLLSVLRRRALIIVVVALLTGGAAAAFAISRGETYESTSKLLFAQTIGPELQAMGLVPGAPDADNLAQSNKQVVGSRQVAAETARRLTTAGWKRSADDVQDNIVVDAARDTDVVEVRASADDAKRAAQLATAYTQVAAEVSAEAQRAQARRALENVQAQLAQPSADSGSSNGALREDAARLRTLADVGTGSPRVIQEGYVPSSATGKPIQTIVLGVAFGLLLGVGLALVREQSDRKLRRNEQLTTAFDAPVLTTVPRSRALKRYKPFADLPPQVTEAFRMLQMNLRFARDEAVRSVMITSARTGEGKTTVSWNLASAAASAGMSVALVEADLRRPSLADRYGLDHGPGLADVLQGDFSIADATQSRALGPQSSGYPSALDVLVAGSPASNPWALMQSSTMARVLAVLARDHDLVVIDTPPIPHVSDAISLLREVDGVLIAVSVGSTGSHDAARLRDQLQGLDANVLGVVANGGSAMSGYAAYARAPVPVTSTNGDGATPGAPLPLGDTTER